VISTQQDAALRLKCTFSHNRKQHQPFTANQSLSVLLFYDVLLPWEGNTCSEASFNRQSQIGHPYGRTCNTNIHSFCTFSFGLFFGLSLMRCLVLIAAPRSGKSNEIYIGLKVIGDALIQSYLLGQRETSEKRRAASSFP